MFIAVLLSNCTPFSLHMLKCTCAHNFSCFLRTVLLPVLGMLILSGLLSHQIVGKVCICDLSLSVLLCFLKNLVFHFSINSLQSLAILLFTPTNAVDFSTQLCGTLSNAPWFIIIIIIVTKQPPCLWLK